MKHACIALAVLAVGWGLPGETRAQAPTIFNQGPCPGQGLCATLNKPTNLVVRAFTFNTRNAGRALVTFDGSMQCGNESYDPTLGVIDFNTQIVDSVGATASVTGPSGNRIAMRLPPLDKADYSAAISLSGTRAYSFKPGPKTVVFTISPNRLDKDITCNVLSAAFTVLFFPSK